MAYRMKASVVFSGELQTEKKMKLILAATLFLFATAAQASDLYCTGSGYEIRTSPGLHAPWDKVSVSLNGVTIVDNLNENGSSFIQADDVTGAYTQIVRAATVKNGVISSLILAIKLNPNGGYTGVGNAVIFDGAVVTTASALDCKAP